MKKMFNDTALEAELDVAGYQFSSANSINIGRLIPQVAYYVYAYAKLYKNGAIAKDEKINVVVPTGNFGNILAAFYAKNSMISSPPEHTTETVISFLQVLHPWIF